jgi:hypothetical protein
MDRISNPFAPGAGNPPPELAGRSALIDDARVHLARIKAGRPSQSLILTGLRGVGKTVLLTKIRELAEDAGYAAVSIEAHEGKRLPEMVVPPLRELLFSLSMVEQSRQLAQRALRVLKSFVNSVRLSVGGVTFEIGTEAEAGIADSGDLEADLARLLEVVAEAAKAAARPVILLMDELQYLEPKEFSALIMGLHRISQRQLPLTMIGAGLPQTLALAGNSKSYTERLFKFPPVGALEPADARQALEKPVIGEGARFVPEALDSILQTTQRYPYFLQQWGYDAWNAATNSPITLSDVDQATINALKELDQGFFKVRFDRCTPAEKRGPGQQRSGDIAERLGVKVTSLGPVRSALIRKGMVFSPAHGITAFTVPLFDAFMKRAMPEDTSDMQSQTGPLTHGQG